MFKKAQKKDINLILEMLNQQHQKICPDILTGWIFKNIDKHIDLIMHQNKVVGFITTKFFKNENTLKLYDLYVKAEYRRMGIATRTLQSILDTHKFAIEIYIKNDHPFWEIFLRNYIYEAKILTNIFDQKIRIICISAEKNKCA